MPVDVSWILETPVPPAPPSEDVTAPAVTRADASSPLGYGLLRPFRRDQKADFAAAGGIELVKSAVGQILGTLAGNNRISGELPWRTDFGSQLMLLRHRNNNLALADIAKAWIVEALQRWEPRVQITSVKITQEEAVPGEGRNVLLVRLRYNILTKPAAGNSVILPDVSQTVTIVA